MKKYKILGEFIKDISAETKDVESYIYTKENISKYKMFIDINTKPLKNKMAEVSISTKFKETDESSTRSYFEMVYAVVVKIDVDYEKYIEEGMTENEIISQCIDFLNQAPPRKKYAKKKKVNSET